MSDQEGKNTIDRWGYSAIVGVIMVAVGVIVTMLSFFQYRKTEKQLRSNSFVSSIKLPVFIALILLTGGILLMVYFLVILP